MLVITESVVSMYKVSPAVNEYAVEALTPLINIPSPDELPKAIPNTPLVLLSVPALVSVQVPPL